MKTTKKIDPFQKAKTIKHVFSLQNAIKRTSSGIFIPKRGDFSTWIKIGLAELLSPAEVCFRIVDKKEIHALNHLYRKKDNPTNVLSFPSDLPENIPQEVVYLGDIVICAEILYEEALEQNKPLEAHWAHIVLHGLLHLLGYDHVRDEDALVMETVEIQLLNQLGWKNPYEENIHD